MSKDDSLRDLIERVEGSPEGSRELDHAIADAVLGKVKPPYVRGHCEKYSTSIDAAMTLVVGELSGMEFSADETECWGCVISTHLADSEGFGGTPALALVAASLRAHMGTGG